MGLGIGLPPPDPALQRPPLLVLSVGVLHTDPLGRLPGARSLPGGQLLGWRVLGGLGWRGVDPTAKRLGQAPVASIDLGPDVGVSPEQVLDPLGLDRRLIMHPTGPHRPSPQRPTLAVADGGGLDGVLLALAGDERPPPRLVGPWPSDLGLGPVKAQLDPLRRGVGEHVGQGPKAHAGHAWDGEAAAGQQGSDLVDGAGDGGAVHPAQHRQGLVGQLEAQNHQGDQDPIAEDQLMAGAGAGGAAAWVAAAGAQRALVGGGPRVGELGDQVAQVLPRQSGEDRMGEGRTGPWWSRHPRMMTVRPVPCATRCPRSTTAIAHQVVIASAAKQPRSGGSRLSGRFRSDDPTPGYLVGVGLAVWGLRAGAWPAIVPAKLGSPKYCCSEEAAVSTPQTVLLGAIAGSTIFLGLPLGRLRTSGTAGKAFLNAVSAGILLFLLLDILEHATGPLEQAMEQAVDGQGGWGRFAAHGAVYVLGLGVGLLGLFYLGPGLLRCRVAPGHGVDEVVWAVVGA